MPFDNLENKNFQQQKTVAAALLQVMAQMPALQAARSGAPMLPPLEDGAYALNPVTGEYEYVTYWKAGQPVVSAPVAPE